MHVFDLGSGDCSICKNYQPEGRLVDTERYSFTNNGQRARLVVCGNCIDTMHALYHDKDTDDTDDNAVVADVRRSPRRTPAATH